MRKCVFFDRDGIVNESPSPRRYVERWEDFRLLPPFVRLLRRTAEAGYAAVVVTNQRGVALGAVAELELERIHRLLRERLKREHGLELLDILYCPHDEGTCQCRKPRPGMLLEAARRHGLDLKGSWMIGDSETDVEAGRRAGCRTVLVGGAAGSSIADIRVADLAELESRLDEMLDGPAGSVHAER
jgi:D-glycero-D-manno-heptose 1,7-bisphosphate phosphatase